MTNSEPPNNNNNGNIFDKFIQIVKQPRTQIIAGVTLASLGVAGYVGLRFLINQVLPNELEKILSNSLKREVEVTKVSSYSLTHLTINEILIFPTKDDQSNIEIEQINVNFRLLSLLMMQPLPVNIRVNKIEGFTQLDTLLETFETVEEEKTPRDSLKLPALPIDTELSLKVDNIDLEVQNNIKTDKLLIENGNANIEFLYDNGSQPIAYQLNVDLAQGALEINGASILETGYSKNEITFENISAPEAAYSFLVFPFDFDDGILDGYLEIEVPSIKDNHKTTVNGVVNADNIEIKLPNPNNIEILRKPILADTKLAFEGQKMAIEELNGSLGNLGGKITGIYDLQEGYKIAVDLNSFDLSETLPQFDVKLPVYVDGLAKAEFLVTGKAYDPIIEGKINSKNTVVDKVLLGEVDANFLANSGDLILKKVIAKPTAGGQFVATGVVKTDIKKKFTNKGNIDITKMPLNINFKTTLPAGEILLPYNVIPPQIKVGDLLAEGKIIGNFKKPQASVEFNIPNASASSVGKISGNGKLVYFEDKVSVINTEILAGNGKIFVDGNGNLKTKLWKGNLVANQFYLTPFLQIFCQNSASCDNQKIDLTTPVNLANANIQLSGNIDNVALNNLDGKANLDLRIDGGSLLVNSDFDNGDIQAIAKARQIPVSEIFKTIGLNTRLISSDIAIDSTVEDLLSFDSQTNNIPSNSSIIADSTLAVEGGIINANTSLNSNTTEIIADVKNISLEEILPSLPADVEATDVDLIASAKTNELFRFIKQPFDLNKITTIDSLNANADLTLKVNNTGIINATTNVDSANTQLIADVKNVSLEEILPSLPTDVEADDVDLIASANTDELFRFASQPFNLSNVANINSLNANANLRLKVDGAGIVNASTNLNSATTKIVADVNNVSLEEILPSLPTDVEATNVDLTASANTDELFRFASQPFKLSNVANINSLNANADLRLKVDGAGIVNASTQLNSAITKIVADVNNVSLNKILPSIAANVEATNIDLTASANTDELFRFASQPFELNRVTNLDSLNANADVQLKVGTGIINADAKINNNLINLTTIANNISPQEIVSNLPIEAKNLNGKLNLNANLSEVLAFGNNYLDNKVVTNIPSLNLTTEGSVEVAEGKVFLKANTDNNKWRANINTNQINPEVLANQLSLFPNTESWNIASLDANATLSGNVNSLLNPNGNIPIQLESFAADLGENSLNGSGNLTVSRLLTKPDISSLNLDVQANTNLASLPLNQILANSNEENNFIPREIDVTGKANFNGNVRGRNLLSNPLGSDNLALNGNLNLVNFSLNGNQFESPLSGEVAIIPNQKIAIDLRGENDVIAAKFVPGKLNIPNTNVTLPYLPDNIEIRQGGEDGILIAGNRKNNQFFAKVNNFPLDSLNISPIKKLGVLGEIEGIFSAELAINLNDFTGRGKVRIENPAVGNIEATEIVSNFSYENNIARLENAALKFGKSEYNLEGGVNFATGEIDGKLLVEGDVNDLFTTLKISDLNTVSALIKNLQSPGYLGSAENIGTASVGSSSNTIKEKLNLLYQIDQQIQEIAKKIEAGAIPNDLEVIGKYEGEILVDGTISKPKVEVEFEGNNWQWLPQDDFPNIVDSLGLIIQENQSIPIPKVFLKAEYKDEEISIDKLNLNIGRSKIYFAGNLSLPNQSGEFKVSNLSLDLLENFVALPVDLSGDINADGKFDGNLVDPQMVGNVEIVDLALDGKFIDKNIGGAFTYNDHTLKFNTNSPEEIQVAAVIPYHPLVYKSEPTTIDIDLDTDAIALLGVLTNGQIALSGGKAKGDVSIQIASMSDFVNSFSTQNNSPDNIIKQISLSGKVLLEEAEFASVALTNPLTLTGELTFLDNPKAIRMDDVRGDINETKLSLTGILPLWKPINNNPNPFQVVINKQDINLEGLYTGKVAANIDVLGTALKPEIDGSIYVGNGSLSIPNRQGKEKIENAGNWQKWLGQMSEKTAGVFQPQLNDVEIELENLELSQWGLYRFNFGGDLVVNGSLLNLQQMRADGAIDMQKGVIYIGGSVRSAQALSTATTTSQTSFFLSNIYDNQIVFNPAEPILNPRVDIQVEADIADYSRDLPPIEGNEIPDPISRSGQAETIRVVLNIDGNADQLLPSLGGSVQQACALYTDKPIIDDVGFSEQKLEKLSQCVNLSSLRAEGKNLGILNSPIIELTSIPSRSEGELVNLIVGGQLLQLANQLQNLSGQQLFETGIVQFVLVPLAQNVSFAVNDTTREWGKSLGMKDLRVFPLVEGVYQIQEKNNVSISYDYLFNEFKVRYQVRF